MNKSKDKYVVYVGESKKSQEDGFKPSVKPKYTYLQKGVVTKVSDEEYDYYKNCRHVYRIIDFPKIEKKKGNFRENILREKATPAEKAASHGGEISGKTQSSKES